MPRSLCYTVHHTVQQLYLLFAEMLTKTHLAHAPCNVASRQMMEVIENNCNSLCKQALGFMFVI